jgi:hypothetical protein
MGDYDAAGCGVEADIPKLYIVTVSPRCYGLEIGISLAVFCQVQVTKLCVYSRSWIDGYLHKTN